MNETKEIRQENKMGTMPMLRLILSMSLPAMFSMTIMAMYNVVDSIFIGNYDQAGLTAISLAYPLQLFLIAASVGTAIGVNSLVSRKLGEKNYDQAHAAATHGLITCAFTYTVFLGKRRCDARTCHLCLYLFGIPAAGLILSQAFHGALFR